MTVLTKPETVRFDKKRIRDLYASGLSSRQVAAVVGCSGRYAWQVCKDIARDRYDAAKLRQPPTKFWPRACRQAARIMVERSLGRKLLRHEVVHHINHDCTDNRLENLTVMNNAEHARYHLRQIHGYNPTPRHLRPERKKYMKAYLREYEKRRRNASSDQR